MQPLEREAQPEDVANAVVFLTSERAAQITGIVLPIDGGTTAGPPYAQTKLIMSTALPREGDARRPVSRGDRSPFGYWGELEVEALQAPEEERGEIVVLACIGRAMVVL